MVTNLENDLIKLKRSHPDLRHRLGAAKTLEDFIVGFRERLGDIDLIIQDEFSRDIILPISQEESLVLSAG